MTRPHAALLSLAAERPLPRIDDADALVASAHEHRMQGLLWHAVERGATTLPKEHVAQLARDHLNRRAHHMRLWTALEDIDRRLGDAGLPVATFKGVAAEQRWYPTMGTRPCTDLDLLLRPGQLGRVDDAVRLLQPDASVLAHARELVLSGVLPSLDLELPGGVDVDLHADVLKVEVPTRQREIVWERTVQISTPGGATIRALDGDLSLVHFLIHLNKDRFAQLLGFVDVARILRTQPLDWSFIDGFVRGEGLSVPVYESLRRVVDTLGLPVPAGALNLGTVHWVRRGPVQWATPGGVRTAVWRRLWREQDSLQGYRGQMTRERRQLLIPWLAMGRQTEALWWWVRRRVLPPRDLIRYYLPDTSGPYLWRLVTGRLRRRLVDRRRVAELARAEATRSAGEEPAAAPPGQQR